MQAERAGKLMKREELLREADRVETEAGALDLFPEAEADAMELALFELQHAYNAKNRPPASFFMAPELRMEDVELETMLRAQRAEYNAENGAENAW